MPQFQTLLGASLNATARMLDETRLAGATAAVGMGLGGVMVAVVLPLVWS